MLAVIDRLSSSSLEPTPEVGDLFGQLVTFALSGEPAESLVHRMAAEDLSALHDVCARGEAALELQWAQRAATDGFSSAYATFPYARNYQDLVRGELSALRPHLPPEPRFAFLGCGPFPLSPLLYSDELPTASVLAVDRSQEAVAAAVAGLHGRRHRLRFRCADAFDLDYQDVDVVVVAALVGATSADKEALLRRIRRSAARGTLVCLRSVVGGRELLYPRLRGEFPGYREVGRFVPHDEVVNSLHVLRIVG